MARARATQPVSVAGIEFDALIEQRRQFDATIPQYVTEEGYQISDAIILEAETLSMTLFVTDTPITWRSHQAVGRTEAVCRQLEQLYFSKTPVTVSTSEGRYDNMGIQSITISKSFEVGYAREIPITFKKIRTTAVRGVTGDYMPPYPSGGTTGLFAGTGSTSKAGSANSNKTLLLSGLDALGWTDTILNSLS